MDLPETVREMVYLEIFDWVGFELLLLSHEGGAYSAFKEDMDEGYHGLMYAVRSFREYQHGNMIEVDSNDRRSLRYALREMRRIVNSMPTGPALAQSLRYPTLLNLMSTCKTIRQEVDHSYWIYNQFHFWIDTPPPSGSTKWSVSSLDGSIRRTMNRLQQPFGNGLIADRIRRVRIVCPDYSGIPDIETTVQESVTTRTKWITTIIERLPRLTWLTIYLSGLEDFEAFKSFNALTSIFDSLRNAPNLRSVHVENVAITSDLAQFCRSQLGNGIVLTASANPTSDLSLAPHTVFGAQDLRIKRKYAKLTAGLRFVDEFMRVFVEEEVEQLEYLFDRADYYSSFGIPELDCHVLFVRPTLAPNIL